MRTCRSKLLKVFGMFGSAAAATATTGSATATTPITLGDSHSHSTDGAVAGRVGGLDGDRIYPRRPKGVLGRGQRGSKVASDLNVTRRRSLARGYADNL